MNPSQDPNKNSEPLFRPSKFLTLRTPKIPIPSALQSQPQSQKNEPNARNFSEDNKPKLVPNSKSARRRDLSVDQAVNDAMEEEISLPKKGLVTSKKNLLFSSKKDEAANKTLKGQGNQRLITSNKGVVFGGGLSGSGTSLNNYNKDSKLKTKIFDANLEHENLYKGRKFLFPIEVKKKKDEQIIEDAVAIEQQESKPTRSEGQEKEIIDSLLNEFCFFQLPANLPFEGCYELTPKTEDPDMEINTDDLLKSFLSNKFDSTGFYLERDFKLLKEKSLNKMVEEKDLKNLGMGKERGLQDKLYDTYKIGKLCRMKNGDIKMRIGNNYFDVTQGVQDSFYKELFVIDYTDKHAMSLFPVEKKFVVKPNMESFY